VGVPLRRQAALQLRDKELHVGVLVVLEQDLQQQAGAAAQARPRGEAGRPGQDRRTTGAQDRPLQIAASSESSIELGGQTPKDSLHRAPEQRHCRSFLGGTRQAVVGHLFRCDDSLDMFQVDDDGLLAPQDGGRVHQHRVQDPQVACRDRTPPHDGILGNKRCVGQK
jgi:hypothetical protein